MISSLVSILVVVITYFWYCCVDIVVNSEAEERIEMTTTLWKTLAIIFTVFDFLQFASSVSKRISPLRPVTPVMRVQYTHDSTWILPWKAGSSRDWNWTKRFEENESLFILSPVNPLSPVFSFLRAYDNWDERKHLKSSRSIDGSKQIFDFRLHSQLV